MDFLVITFLDVCLLCTVERLTRDARMAIAVWLLYVFLVGEALVGSPSPFHNNKLKNGVDAFLLKPEEFPRL